MCDTQTSVGDEFLKKPFVSSDSVDMLIKRRKGKWSEWGGLGRVGVIGRNGMLDEFLQVSRLLQSKGESVELGSAGPGSVLPLSWGC